MPILRAKTDSNASAGFLIMRYTEQLKSSWNYNWRLFREIWDAFTLHNYHWLVVGLLVVLCVIPSILAFLPSAISYYISTPVPPFDSTVPQDIISPYFFIVREPPQLWSVISYHWVMNSGFMPLTKVLSVASIGLLIVAYLREGNPQGGVKR